MLYLFYPQFCGTNITYLTPAWSVPHFKKPPIQSGLCITCITCSFHLFCMYQKLIIICIIFSSTSSRSTQEETQKIRKGTCCKIMPNETCRTAHYSGSKQVREQQKLAAFLLLVILLKDAPVIRQPMKSFDWRTLCWSN